MLLTKVKQIYWKCLAYKERRREIAWQRQDNPEGVSLPVFLTGCARSGTTMTAKSLAKSMAVDFYSDGNTVAFNNWYLRDFFTIHKLLENSHARIILFHINNELLHTPYFLDRHPASKAILVFRHYMDVVNSTLRNRWEWVKGQAIFDLELLRRTPKIQAEYQRFFKLLGDTANRPLKLEPGEWTKHSNYAPMLETCEGEALYYAIRWLLYATIPLDRNWLQDSRLFLVNYERIVTRPNVYLQRLCDFIGIEYSSRLIDDIHSDSVRKHPAIRLPQLILEACEEVYRELCQLEQAQWGPPPE